MASSLLHLFRDSMQSLHGALKEAALAKKARDEQRAATAAARSDCSGDTCAAAYDEDERGGSGDDVDEAAAAIERRRDWCERIARSLALSERHILSNMLRNVNARLEYIKKEWPNREVKKKNVKYKPNVY